MRRKCVQMASESNRCEFNKLARKLVEPIRREKSSRGRMVPSSLPQLISAAVRENEASPFVRRPSGLRSYWLLAGVPQ